MDGLTDGRTDVFVFLVVVFLVIVFVSVFFSPLDVLPCVITSADRRENPVCGFLLCFIFNKGKEP